MGLDVEVPAESPSGCVAVVGTNPLDEESDGNHKQYCPGVGLTTDEELDLVLSAFKADRWPP